MSSLVINLFVNTELKMKPGKIAAQVSHAVNKLHRNIVNHRSNETLMANYNAYIHGTDHVVACIAYKATLEEMEEIMLTHAGEIVTDAGLTQVPANSKTVMALYPRVRDNAFANFKLL